MPISTADAAKLRASRHRIELVLNRVPLQVVASAQISQTAFVYPLNTLAVDNVSPFWLTRVKRGQAFSIGTTPGGSDVTWGVVKQVPQANVFKFDAKSLGDSGYATDIRLGIAEDQYITVYAHRPMWGVLSAIRNKIFYKDFDTAYTNQGSQPDPILNLGEHIQRFVDPDTGVVRVTIPGTGLPWGAATNSSRAWSCQGATAIGSETGASVTYEFTPGFYIVECLLTDSNSKTQRSYRYVFINDREGVYPPFEAPWSDLDASTDRDGLKMSLTVYGNFTTQDIYPGQFWMVSEYAYYNGEPLENEADRVSSFVGYLSERSIERTVSTPSVTLTLESPLVYAKRIGAASQQIVEKSSPARWTECTSVLSNPPGAAWYILHHHAPNILDGHDFVFDPLIKNLRKQSFLFQAGTIGPQLDLIKDLMLGNIGCRADGSLVMAQIPHYMNNNDRNALDNKFTWNEGDIGSPLSYPFTFHVPVGIVKGNAFAYSGGATATPFMSRAPGTVQAQGGGAEEITVIVPVSTGQVSLNEVTGHYLAVTSAPTPQFSLSHDCNLDIAEPADCNVWHTFNVPSTYDPMGEGWVNKRMIPLRVSRTWEQSERGLVKSITSDWQPEVFGQPGVTVPVPRGGAENELADGVNTQIPVPFDPRIRAAFALAWDSAGELGRTSGFNSSFPHYQDSDAGISGLVCDVALNYQSEFFQTGVGVLGAWAVVTDDDELKIYYNPDVRTAPPDWDLQKVYTMFDQTVTTSARIASSKTLPGFVVAAWKDGRGTSLVRTQNNGLTWEDRIQVGSQIVDNPYNNNAELGLAVEGDNQLVSAPDSSGDFFLYKATAVDGAFTKVTSSPSAESPFPFVAMDGQGNAYTRTPPAIPVSNYLVTFDDGGYTDFDIDSNFDSEGEFAEGNPGSSARAFDADGTGFGDMKVCVNFATQITLPAGTVIEYDWKYDWGFRTSSTLDSLQSRVGWSSSSCTPGDYSFVAILDSITNANIVANKNTWQHSTYTITSEQTLVDHVVAVILFSHNQNLLDVELFIDNISIDLP